MELTNKFLFFLALTLMTLASCGGDDNDGCDNQVMQGGIDGQAFTLGDGRAVVDDNTIKLDFYGAGETFPDDICSGVSSQNVRIFGTLQSAEVGRTELNLDFSSPETSQTLTLFNPDGSLNIIASDGFIEITAITETEVIGFLKADGGGEDVVCGTFTLTNCR